MCRWLSVVYIKKAEVGANDGPLLCFASFLPFRLLPCRPRAPLCYGRPFLAFPSRAPICFYSSISYVYRKKITRPQQQTQMSDQGLFGVCRLLLSITLSEPLPYSPTPDVCGGDPVVLLLLPHHPNLSLPMNPFMLNSTCIPGLFLLLLLHSLSH